MSGRQIEVVWKKRMYKEGRKRNMKRQMSQEREHSKVSVNICASDSVSEQQKHARARKACTQVFTLLQISYSFMACKWPAGQLCIA